MKGIVFGTLFLLLARQLIWAQEEGGQKKWTLSGYISNMQSAMFQDVQEDWVTENLIHNRLNFTWYPSSSFTASMQIRNRFIYGEMIKIVPGYPGMISSDPGYWDLSRNLIDERSFLFNSSIDRAWVKYTQGKLEITAGRQRINWGRSFVWNPNDIFNTYSFFDFDYEEKPGSDAIRVQYYTGSTSTFELAAKMNKDKELTAAAMYHWGMLGYDFQVLAGVLDNKDYVTGFGWEGNIYHVGFRGGMSYFRDKHNFSDTAGIVVASVTADYTFKNSFYIQAEALYNQLPGDFSMSGFDDFYYMPLSAKRLSFTEVSLFGQCSYPVTPLLNGSLSGMYYPVVRGYFLGPSLDYSLRDDLYLMLLVQSFKGELTDNITTSMLFAFLRLKWNF